MKKRIFNPAIIITLLALLTVFSVSACSYNAENTSDDGFLSIFGSESKLMKQNKDDSIVLFNEKNKEVTLYRTDIIADLNDDNKCTASDARELLRIASSMLEYDGDIKDIDIDMNGKITSADARLALRFSARLDSYYTDSHLKCDEGFYSDSDGNRYYFYANGRGAKGVISVDGAYYCFGTDRKMKTGFHTENTLNYYFGEDGKGCQGEITKNGITYVFDETGKGLTGNHSGLYYKNGTVFTGWVNDTDTYYYEKGIKTTGRKTIDGACYYFRNDGKMVKNEKIDGIYFGKDGKAQTADASFFDDAVFIGDSVSVKLAAYQQETKCFGNATMCAASSLSAANSLWQVSDASVHPYYNGRKTLVEDCVKLSGKKKVFIMLGMNDIGLYGQETSIRNYKELVARIKAKSPDVDIYIQSMTLMTSISERADKNLNNTQIKAYNEKLKAMCNETGWHYLDIASATCDSTGSYLPIEYCSDPVYMGLHFSTAGCEKWVEYLYENVLLV